MRAQHKDWQWRIARAASNAARYREYEKLKREWHDAHPYATSEQYAKAVREIAEKVGI